MTPINWVILNVCKLLVIMLKNYHNIPLFTGGVTLEDTTLVYIQFTKAIIFLGIKGGFPSIISVLWKTRSLHFSRTLFFCLFVFSDNTTKLSVAALAALFQVWKTCSNQSTRSSCSQLLKRDLASCVSGWHFTSNRNTSRRWEFRLKNPRLLAGEMSQEDEVPRGWLESGMWCSGKSAALDSPSC